MNPTSSDMLVSRLLTNFSIAAFQDENNFVAEKVFPVVPVELQNGTYYIFDQRDLTSDEMKPRAESTESEGSGFRASTDTYKAEVFALHKDIDDRVRVNVGSEMALDKITTKWLTHKALIKKERLFAARYMAPSVWGTTITGVASGETAGTSVRQWSDLSNSNPITDILNINADQLERTGQLGNTLVLGYRTYLTLLNHPDFIERTVSGGRSGAPAMIRDSDLAELFRVDRVLVMKAIYNAANPAATINNQFIVGKGALLLYTPASPAMMEPASGYTFAWSGLLGSGPSAQRIKKFRMEPINSDRIEIEIAQDMKIVGGGYGVYYNSLIP